MMLLDKGAVLSLFSGLVLGQLSLYALRRKERIRVRADHANKATSLLTAHDSMIDKFMDDVASPEILKEVLLDFGESISSHKAAIDFADLIVRHKTLDVSERTKPVLSTLDTLRKSRVDLAQNFDGAILTGLYYMLLRWPDTARVFEDAAANMAVDPRKSVTFASRVIHPQSAKTSVFEHETRQTTALAC